MSKEPQTRHDKVHDLVIFDFDGTLADTSQVFIEAFDKAAPSVGAMPYKRNETARLKQLKTWEVLHQHGVAPDQVFRFTELMRLEMSSRLSEGHLFPRAVSILTKLVSEGHTLAVLTSNSRESVTGVVGEAVDKLFSFSCFDTPLTGKEEALKKLMSGMEVAPATVFYVGDELTDYCAASKAGVNFIGVSWGFNSAQSLRTAGAPTVINDLAELPAMLPSSKSEDLTQYLDALYGYAMILSRDSSTAADLVQETYLRAIAAKDRLWENSAVKSWLFTILRNIWFNQLRKAKGEQTLQVDDEEGVTRVVAVSTEPSSNPGLAYEQKVTQEMVRGAIAQLPQEFREVILLREFEDLSYQEIAEILSCPPGTVMSRLARARAKLRILLTDSGRPDDRSSNQVPNSRNSLVGS